MKEYKVLEFKKKKDFAVMLEQPLAERSAEGWEVVSMTVDISRISEA